MSFAPPLEDDTVVNDKASEAAKGETLAKPSLIEATSAAWLDVSANKEQGNIFLALEVRARLNLKNIKIKYRPVDIPHVKIDHVCSSSCLSRLLQMGCFRLLLPQHLWCLYGYLLLQLR